MTSVRPVKMAFSGSERAQQQADASNPPMSASKRRGSRGSKRQAKSARRSQVQFCLKRRASLPLNVPRYPSCLQTRETVVEQTESAPSSPLELETSTSMLSTASSAKDQNIRFKDSLRFKGPKLNPLRKAIFVRLTTLALLSTPEEREKHHVTLRTEVDHDYRC